MLLSGGMRTHITFNANDEWILLSSLTLLCSQFDLDGISTETNINLSMDSVAWQIEIISNFK